MLFNSLDFLLFLPVAVLVFWWLPGRARLGWLIFASLVFYASFGLMNLLWLGIVAMIVLTVSHLVSAPSSRVRALGLWGGTFSILLLMGLLKYHDPIARMIGDWPEFGLTSPAGFSFYAFSAIALMIDRHREPPRQAANTGEDLLYLCWFPKILAGPIERVGPFVAQLAETAPLTWPQLASGGQLILWGLVKKVVIADNLAPFVDRTYAIPGYAVPVELIIASYFFAFQIYCDFSGYTDIARGASRLFGIDLSENFRRSYFAHSISEFWSRRWHISLSEWFRDYVYFPITGESRSFWRVYAGLMLVFVLSGIWHAGLGYGIGWGFLVWGALNGAYLWAERALNPLRRRLRKRLGDGWLGRLHTVLAVLVVFHLVLITWVFFRAADIPVAITILSRIGQALPDLPTLLPRFPFTAEHLFGLALIMGLLAVEAVMERPELCQRFAAAPAPLRWSVWLACLFLLVILGRWQGEAFFYMQF